MERGNRMRIEIDESELIGLKSTIRLLSRELEVERNENQSLQDKLSSAKITIRTELEPRIQAEKISYDGWVTNPRGLVECETFIDMVDEILYYVEDNLEHFDWEDKEGELYPRVLFALKQELEEVGDEEES